ncbi:hypothetical protein JCGZ_16746 [Jatropha curcas]|uniref:Uncharacterized protein n=1 Tax=Jatropha curcas TaxID=180498 RepID=A0A067LGZ2_JATCU|nr:hypothetical protein JCGZ_16746 [Jatropha curcas]
MASVTFNSLAIVFLVAVLAAASAVSAQDLSPAAPPNSAAYSLGMSGAVICSSLLLSVFALLKH